MLFCSQLDLNQLMHVLFVEIYRRLMAKVQLLQGKAAKLILDKAKHSSATEAINELDWLVLSERRRQHRLSFVFKCMHGMIDWNFKFTHLRETHPYNTRHKGDVLLPKSRCQWGQQRLTYQGYRNGTVFQCL